MELNLEDSYVGVESRDTLERRDLHVWQKTSGLFSGSYYNLDFVSSQGGTGGALHTESPERKRASIPHPERMVRAAATFGISPSEKRTLDLVTDHPMIPRGAPSPLARRLRGTAQPDDAQSREHLELCRTDEENGETPATRCPTRAYATSPTVTVLSSRRHGASGAQPSRQTIRAGHGTWDTASIRGLDRRGTPTASLGSSRNWKPRPEQSPTAICCGRCPPRDPTGPTTGASLPSPPTPWGR